MMRIWEKFLFALASLLFVWMIVRIAQLLYLNVLNEPY
jgi:hypothetical protein